MNILQKTSLQSVKDFMQQNWRLTLGATFVTNTVGMWIQRQCFVAHEILVSQAEKGTATSFSPFLVRKTWHLKVEIRLP